MYPILQSSTAQPLVFLLVQSSDHITGLTGASPTVTLRKVGGSFASPSGAVTEIANGWYQVAGNATDSNTLGPLLLHATATSGDPSDVCYHIVAYNPQDAVHLGLSSLPNTAVTTNASLITSGSGTDQLSVSSGIASADAKRINAVSTSSVTTVNAVIGTTQPVNFTGTGTTAYVKSDMIDIASAAVSTSAAQIGVNLVNIAGSAVSTSTAQIGANVVNIGGSASVGAAGYVGIDWAHVNAPTTTVDLSGTTISGTDNAVATTSNIKKNTAVNNFMFVMTDSTTHAPKTGLTVTATRSLDGAAFGACANAVSEIANGWYQINLAATDTNANRLALRFTASGADDLDIAIITQP